MTPGDVTIVGIEHKLGLLFLTDHYLLYLLIKAPFTRYNRLYRVYKHSTGCQTRLTTGLTTGCIVYTAGCQPGCTTRFDNRLDV